ncbi:unnamed protein product [Prunus armeniaca]|uniref:Uncharacterized protein n=1 Tax=Prunus armeniaca TaxID=36596 RepID=A0A6J5UPN9_PRUAR|nr:unnamed protein product [Prunus armeniaca]
MGEIGLGWWVQWLCRDRTEQGWARRGWNLEVRKKKKKKKTKRGFGDRDFCRGREREGSRARLLKRKV